MPPLPTGSALGQRYFPQIADIRARPAQCAAGFQPLSPILMLLWITLGRILRRLDSLALGVRNAPPSPAAPQPGIPHSGDGRIQPSATGHHPNGDARPIRTHRLMAQRAPRVALLVDAPDFATAPAHIHRAPAPHQPCLQVRRLTLSASTRRRRKPPD